MNHHSLTLFLPTEPTHEQATELSPPAPKQPAERVRSNLLASLRFMAGVVANAAGFGMLLAGCWFSLQLIEWLLVS